MDKTGSDLRNIIGVINYTVYTESGSPTYRKMILKQGKDKYDIRFDGEILTVNGAVSDIGRIPKNVDSLTMY